MPHHNPPKTGAKPASGLDPDFISVAEAARILDLSQWQIYQFCYAGVLKSVKQGRRRSVIVASVREYKDRLIAEADAS